MLHAGINELLGALILELTAGIAPFAVFLVERAVRLAAGYFVLERHTAALADVPARRAEKRIDGDVKERRQALERALTALPQRDRLLFYRKYYYRQSTAQIAAELGTTERAVEGRLYRIKKALRKALGGDDA